MKSTLYNRGLHQLAATRCRSPTRLTDTLSSDVSPTVITVSQQLTGGSDATSATAQFSFDHNPAPGDTVTIDGTTFTFTVGHMTGPNEVQIGSDLSATLSNLLNVADYSGLSSSYEFECFRQ